MNRSRVGEDVASDVDRQSQAGNVGADQPGDGEMIGKGATAAGSLPLLGLKVLTGYPK